MFRKIQMKRGLLASLPALDIGEIGFTTDAGRIFIGGAGGNIEIATGAGGGGTGPQGPPGPQGPKGDPGDGSGGLEINVANFGATGEGANYTAEINAAINSLPAEGGTVVIGPGHYMINAGNPYNTITNATCINVKSNMTLKIHPNARLEAITNNQDNYAIILVRAVTNVTIEGGWLIGERDTHTGAVEGQCGDGIWIEGASDITIRGVKAEKMWGDGIYTKFHPTLGNSKNILIDGVHTLNNRRQGISICAVDIMKVVNSTFETTQGTDPAAGIDIEPELGGSVSNLVIDGNIFKGNKVGIQALGIASATISDNVFDGQTMWGIYLGTCEYYNVSGNTITGCGSHGIYLNFATDCTIANNTVKNGLSHGIYALNGCYRNTFADNITEHNTGFGILLDKAHENTISNNKANYNTRSGINTDSSNDNDIFGNHCEYNTQNGVYVFAGSGNTLKDNHVLYNGDNGIKATDTTDVDIKDNYAKGNSTTTDLVANNIFVSGATANARISGNFCRKGAGANQPGYGLRIDATTVTGAWVMDDNDFRGSGKTADIRDDSLTTIYDVMKGIVAPTRNADFIGQTYIDTAASKTYTATKIGTGAGDWLDNTGSGSGPGGTFMSSADGITFKMGVSGTGTTTWAAQSLDYSLFNGADSTTTLGNGELGGAWVPVGASVWGISGAAAYSVSDLAGDMATRPALASNDYAVTIKGKGELGGTGNFHAPIILIRYVDANNFMYVETSGNRCYLGKYDAGAKTEVMNNTHAVVADNTYFTVQAVAKAGVISVYFNAVKVFDYTLTGTEITKFTSPTVVGIRQSKSGTPTIPMRIDVFNVEVAP